MRKKISTILDDNLIRQAKMYSVREGKKISEVVAEALEQYLAERGGQASTGVVAETWGALSLERRKVKRILSEEDGLLDA